MKTIITLLTAVILTAMAQDWHPVASLPAPRYSGCAVSLGTRVWYLGGSTNGAQKTRTVFVYHPDEDTWSEGVPMQVARHRFGAAVLGSRIYVFGGWGDGGALLASAECYDTLTGTWTFIESLPTARASLMGASADDRVYAVGGRTSTATLDRVDAYDTLTGNWQPRAPVPTARCEAAITGCGAYILVAGGTDRLGTALYNTTELYDCLLDEWTTQETMPTARAAAGYNNAGNKLYVYGGIGPGLVNTHAHEYYYMCSGHWDWNVPLPSSRRFLAGAMTWGTPYLLAIGGLDSLLQPTALVEALELPMGLDGEPGYPLASTTSGVLFVRPGTPLPARCDVFSALGQRVASGLSACPELAPGGYFLRDAERSRWSRLVVLR